MKCTLQQEVLSNALATVMKTIPTTRSGLPILKHVQMMINASHLTLRGTDLQTSIEVIVPADVSRIGWYTINAKLLADLVKTFPKTGMVSLEVKDEHVLIHCGKRTFSLKEGTDGGGFPFPPNVSSDQFCCLPSTLWQSAIREVWFAAAKKDERNPVHMAICLHLCEEAMHMVALDGKRMSIRRLPLPEVKKREAMVLVPAQAMQLLGSLVPEGALVRMEWNDVYALWSVDTIRFTACLMPGTYPKYQAALPKAQKTTFTLARRDLVSLLTAFKPFTRDSANVLKILYGASGVLFQAESDKVGMAQDTLKTLVEGEGGHVFLDAEFVADVLEAVKSDSFTFAASGYDQPVLLTAVGRDDYQALIMPMSCDRQ